MARFDQTGDTFLELAIRAMLPASSVSTLELHETPYAISKKALRDSNEKIGALYKKPPVEVLYEQKKDPVSIVRLALMMTLAAEFLNDLKKPPLYINSDIGPAKTQRPAIFVCTNFDCGVGDTVVVVGPDHGAQSFNCVSSAVICWASLDKRAQDLFKAVVEPELLDAGSVFKRLVELETDLV